YIPAREYVKTRLRSLPGRGGNKKATRGAWLKFQLAGAGKLPPGALQKLWPRFVSGPISRLDVLFDLAPFVPVLMRFIRAISGLAKRVFWSPYHFADYIQ